MDKIMRENIADMVGQTYTETSERISFMKEILFKLSPKNVWDEKGNMLVYFHKELDNHFRNEELLIDILMRDTKLLPDERKLLNNIIQEHKYLAANFDRAEKLAKIMDQYDNSVKEKYIKTIDLTMRVMHAHAEKENKLFFPMAKKILSDKQYIELRRKISSIKDRIKIRSGG